MENIQQSYQGFNSSQKNSVFHLLSLSVSSDTIDPAVFCFNSFLGVGVGKRLCSAYFSCQRVSTRGGEDPSSFFFSSSPLWKSSLIFTAPRNQDLPLSSVPVCSEAPAPSSTLPHTCSCSSAATSVIALWTSQLSTSHQNEVHISAGRAGLFPL